MHLKRLRFLRYWMREIRSIAVSPKASHRLFQNCNPYCSARTTYPARRDQHVAGEAHLFHVVHLQLRESIKNPVPSLRTSYEPYELEMGCRFSSDVPRSHDLHTGKEI